jgi:hypothetical protein
MLGGGGFFLNSLVFLAAIERYVDVLFTEFRLASLLPGQEYIQDL